MSAPAPYVARAMALAVARLGAAPAAGAMLGLRGDEPAATPAEVAAARPAGWERIHASWAEELLEYGGCVPMSEHPLVMLDPAALVRALAAIGRRQLAHALAGSAPRSIAELAARVPWGPELLADVAAVHAMGDAAETRLGPRAAARARIADLGWADPLALPLAGARAIARVVAAVPDLAQQVAQRLPRPVGTLALRDLLDWASSPGLPRLVLT